MALLQTTSRASASFITGSKFRQRSDDSNFARMFFAVQGRWRGSCQGKNWSDCLCLLLHFLFRAETSGCPIPQAPMIVLQRRILRRRWEPTGTITWIGQISASAGTCVPAASPRNKRLPSPHPKPRPLRNRIRCQCRQDRCLRRQQQALRCQ